MSLWAMTRHFQFSVQCGIRIALDKESLFDRPVLNSDINNSLESSFPFCVD
jgi:hypothetical protein